MTMKSTPSPASSVPASRWFTVSYKVGNSGPFSMPVFAWNEADAAQRFEVANPENERVVVRVEPSPAPVVAPAAEPFVAPAPSGPVVSVCNRLVLDEWSRLAKAAYAAGHNAIGHKFSMGATVSEGTRVCPKWFDSMQDVYRAWLVFGWDDALPAFEKHFGTSAAPAPSPAVPASPGKWDGWVVRSGNMIHVGQAPWRTHGGATVGFHPYGLKSSLGCSDTSDALIQWARAEGVRLHDHWTQAL